MSQRRVVVTGLGTLNPLGHNTEESWYNLLAQSIEPARIKNLYITVLKTHFASEI